MAKYVPARVIFHESGRKSILEGDNVNIEVRENHGKKVDKIVAEQEISGNLDRKKLHKMMEKPQDFDTKKYGGRKKSLRK